MDKHLGFMILILFVQFLSFVALFGLMHELRLIGSVVEGLRKRIAKLR